MCVFVCACRVKAEMHHYLNCIAEQQKFNTKISEVITMQAMQKNFVKRGVRKGRQEILITAI